MRKLTCAPITFLFVVFNLRRGRGCSWSLLFRFLLRRFIPELFALKIEICQKSCRISGVFSVPNFVVAPFPNVVPTLSRLPSASSWGKVSWSYRHYSWCYRHMQNFKPNF